MVLWLALHLPRLPLEIFQRGHDRPAAAANDASLRPFAITTDGPHPQLLLADAEAQRQGIRPGMGLSAAYAIAPDLVVRPRDRLQEDASLEALALWAEQFTPTLSLAPPDALLLEIGGCLKLFEGLDALSARVREGVARLGFDVIAACAPTPGGALMLARSGFESQITERPALRHQLGQLPVESLDIPAATIGSLQRLGMRTVAECLRLPRDGAARRFGQDFLDSLDRALGDLPEPRTPFVPPSRFASRLVLPVPVPDVEPILFGARRLVEELTGFLLGRGAGATRIDLVLAHDKRPATTVSVELSMPSRDPVHLHRLLRERLTRVQLPDAVEAFSLHCTETLQLAPRNFSFFATREGATEDRTALVEHLRARLGRQAVQGLALVPEHRPELAFRDAEPGTASPPPPTAQRPLWLLQTPRPIDRQRLRLLAGPERIESGWWDGSDVRRDYYRAVDAADSFLWVYREANGGEAPERWFVHGLFA